MEIIYGTGNSAKITYMRRALLGLPVEILGLEQALEGEQRLKEYGQGGSLGFDSGIFKVEETGASPLENARQKAESYYRIFKRPVFSCDSGLYLWNHVTGELLPEEEQPGVHVREQGGRRLSDDELLERCIRLVKKYGQVRARYQNAICLIWDERTRAESMDESLCGEPFLLTDRPHARRVEGFPLDRISLDLRTGSYYYDMEENAQDGLVSNSGGAFKRFFCRFFEEQGLV